MSVKQDKDVQGMGGKPSGFTLVELLTTMVILGVLAAAALPRLINLSDNAYIAVHQYSAGAFKTGIMQARAHWISEGAPTDPELRNDMQVIDRGGQGRMDFNIEGWPAQRYSPFSAEHTTNSHWDCMTIWQVFVEGITVSRPADHPKFYKDNQTPDYFAHHIAVSGTDLGNCHYILRENPKLSVLYESRNGRVTIDAEIEP